MLSLTILTLITSLILYFFLSAKKSKEYFEARGIPYMGNGTVRLILNSIKGISMVEDISIQYNKAKREGSKLIGGNDVGMTGLILMDPELFKHVFVKDFEHFSDRRFIQLPKHDWIFSKMLVATKGGTWRALRSKLSPTFTTGKIKRLFKLFDQSAKKLGKYVETEMAESQTGEIDLAKGIAKYTMDVIASAVCGIDSKAFDQKEPSLFELMGKKMQLQFGLLQILKLIVLISSHTLANFLGFSFFGKDVQEFFNCAIKNSIRHRQENKEKGNDFIQLMLEAREGNLESEDSEIEAFEKEAIIRSPFQEVENGKCSGNILDDDGIVSNAVQFINTGNDTTQSLLLFCLYALALNQGVQEALRKQIELEGNGGEFTYDSLNKMTYLDMVINETLRMYPPAPATDRSCTSDYRVPGTDFVLKKGEGVQIPIYGIHHDPDYFPNPEKFDPERFSLERRGNIKPNTFLPFGQGPRNCIGMRFALAEVKVAISHLVYNFKIEPSKNTLIPMKFSKTTSLKPEGGMFLALNKIDHFM